MSETQPSRQRLPRVEQGTGDAVARSIAEAGTERFREEAFIRFSHEQPYLCQAVVSYAESVTSTPEQFTAIVAMSLIMYEALANQAEADEMQKLFDTK